MNQHYVTAARQFVSPRHAAIVLVLMPKHGRMRILRYSRDFAQPEVLVAAMVVEAKDARQLTAGASGLKQERLGGRAKRQLPLQVVDREAIELQSMLQHGDGSSGWAGRFDRLQETRPGYRTPGVQVVEHGLPEGKSRGIP